MKRIAVLMTVHNRREKTLRCLDCLFANNVPEGYAIEVYLTDDGCSDETPEAVREKFADVHIIKGDGNLYWNRGMWTAWNEAAKEEFDYYLWLNDDTFLYDYALTDILKSSHDNDDKAIVVGATEDRRHHSLTYGGRIGKDLPKPDGEDIPIDYFNGNFVLIPRYVFHKLGNLDYHFQHSKGDFDYGMRAKKAGIKMVQIGRIVGECDIHPDLDEWCNPAITIGKRWKALNKPNGMPPREYFYFDKKHKGLWPAVFHYCTITFRCLMPRLWAK